MENFDLEVSRNISQNKEGLLKIKPKFTVVILVDQKNLEYISRTIESIKEQIYDNYEILILFHRTLNDSHLDNNKQNFQGVTCISKILDMQKNSSGDFLSLIHI